MTRKSQTVGAQVGAIVLVLLTVTAVVFGIVNWRQRVSFEVPDDGVSWTDSDQGIRAIFVSPDSPGERAGIKPDDLLVSINDQRTGRAIDVVKQLWTLGVWSQAHYQVRRQNTTFNTTLITAPARKPLTIENYLRVVGLLYLLIGLYIFLRRWNAPRAVHFYIFCLASFVLCSFHYTGKLNPFDWEVYWARLVAMLAAPALLVHFALVFPEKSMVRRGAYRIFVLACYLPAIALLIVHVYVA